MRMKFGRSGLTLAMLAGAAACSQPASNTAEENGANAADPAAVTNSPAEAELPDLAANQAAAAQLPCPTEPGTMCTGPLIVRGEGFALLRNRHENLAFQGALVFETRTGGAVKFAILDLPMAVRLDNGGMLTRHDDFSGVTLCSRDGPRCLQETPERFQTLAPGDSAVRVNSVFWEREDSALTASLPTVATATITFQVYAVGADNSGSVLSVSLPNVPVRNQISR